MSPNLTAHDGPIYWHPAISTQNILLATLPVRTGVPPLEIKRPQGDDPPCLSLGAGRSELHLSWMTQPVSEGTTCIVIPLDTTLPERLIAIQRLWRLLNQAVAPDPRLTPERRERLRAMVRAHDGWRAGASQRDIARCLFGAKRVEAEDWPSSSLRYTTMRLIRDSQSLISQGYRDLLTPTKPDARRRRPPDPPVRT